MHKKEIALGKRAGWEGWQVLRPSGTNAPYTHVAIDMYKDWEQYTSQVDGDAILKEVHPGKTGEQLMSNWLNTTEMVNAEEWYLVDAVVSEQ